MKKIIVAIGLPGSGKSTMLKRLSEEKGWPIISVDAIRKEMTDSEADQSKNAEAWEFAYKRIAVLQAAHPVILFDATLAQQSNRIEFLNEARRSGMDFIQGLYFTAPYSIVQERNYQRERVVPEHAMLRMHEQLTFDEPKLQEGPGERFDELTTIHTDREQDEVYAELKRAVSGTINHELSKLR